MRSIFFASSLAILFAARANVDPVVGFDRFTMEADHRVGPVAAGLWSPVGRATYAGEIGGNAVFEPVQAYIGGALPDEKLPLIVISHGSGSSIDGTACLAAGLAERGALLLVLNHLGTTTGDSSARQTVRLSERAADMSVALDHVLAYSYFSERINRDQITALAFSLGGATVLGLAGCNLMRELTEITA